MAPSTVFLYGSLLILFFVFAPAFALLIRITMRPVKVIPKKKFWVILGCLAVYYTVFFTQVPKVTAPYFKANTHEVSECVIKRAWND